MQLKLIRDLKTLHSHREAWDSLAGEFPFHRWAWLGRWFQELGTDYQPMVLAGINAEGHWIGIAPMCLDETNRLRRTLRLWGSGTACTDYHGVLAGSAHKEPFSLAVADWISEQSGGSGELAHVDLIEWEGINGDSPADRLVCEALEASGLGVDTNELEGCWALDIPETEEQLVADVSKSMRRKVKKAIQRLDDPETEVLVSGTEGLDGLWEQFVQLHQQRRHMLGDAGCFADPRYSSFLESATRELAAEGRAELMVIRYQSQPLAAALLFNDGTTCFMYQSGLDIDRLALEPGYQLALASINRSRERGLKRFDFLRGDEPYKARWLTTRVPMLRIRLVPRKFSAVVKHNLWLTGRSIRNYLQRPQP